MIFKYVFPALVLAVTSLSASETFSPETMAKGQAVHQKLLDANIGFTHAGNEFTHLGITRSDQAAVVYYLRNTYQWEPRWALLNGSLSDMKGSLDWCFTLDGNYDDHYRNWFHQKVESKGRRPDPKAAFDARLAAARNAEYNADLAREQARQQQVRMSTVQTAGFMWVAGLLVYLAAWFAAGREKPGFSKIYFRVLAGFLGVAFLLMILGKAFNGFAIVAVFVLFGAGCIAYFIPTAIARAHSHSNLAGVFSVNLFLGWTLLGWVAALVWALYRSPAASPPPIPLPPSNVEDRLRTLSKLKSDGLISDEEFQAKRSAVLSSLAAG